MAGILTKYFIIDIVFLNHIYDHSHQTNQKKMKLKPEPNLTLAGHKFELRFSNVARHKTTRRTEGGHDHREETTAYVWRGTLEIYSLYSARRLVKPFWTESFWPQHIKGLDLKNILFLCVSKNLYGVEFKDENAKKVVIDYLASELLIPHCFRNDDERSFYIPVFDFRYDVRDKHLKDFGIITDDRLEPKHGVPGSIKAIESVH
jgi:hypothetical protein